MNLNDTTYFVNGVEEHLAYRIFEHNGKAYIPETYLESHYPVEFKSGADARLVMASNLQVEKQLAISTDEDAVIRTHPDKQSAIVDTVLEHSTIGQPCISMGLCYIKPPGKCFIFLKAER